MPIYRLDVKIQPPSEATEDKYLAEVPVLPGCRAWGDTIPEAIASVQSVATAFINSYRERGEALPQGVQALAGDGAGSTVRADILVSA